MSRYNLSFEGKRILGPISYSDRGYKRYRPDSDGSLFLSHQPTITNSTKVRKYGALRRKIGRAYKRIFKDSIDGFFILKILNQGLNRRNFLDEAFFSMWIFQSAGCNELASL